ncbi:MAG: Do family serine endopeptidase [Pseudomonadota bacterium]
MFDSIRHNALVGGAALALASTPAWASGPDSFADIAEQATPAVVTILTEGRSVEAMPDMPNSEFFDRFFGDRGMPFQPPQQGPSRQGLGSGFVIDEDGIIVTNNHVIEDAEEITVLLADGERLKATLIGGDAKTDLAVLSVEADVELPTISFGDTDDLRVGDWVLAVGNPFGVGASVTAGIVSARGRDIRSGPYDDFIQIDASINRGNSGGPLIDTSGTVVGVNTAIFSPSGGNVGIGFAIPSELAQRVIDDLRDDGRVERGWIGVSIQSISPDIADSLDLDKAAGALIASVETDGPADNAKLRAGDVILTFAGEEIETLRDLTRAVADQSAGETVSIVIWRAGEEVTIDLTVGDLKEDEVASAPAPIESSNLASLGVDLAERDDSVIVAEVAPGGAAARQGVAQGDVIVRLGDRSIDSVADAVDAVDEARDNGRDTILALIERDGTPRFVPFDLTLS